MTVQFPHEADYLTYRTVSVQWWRKCNSHFCSEYQGLMIFPEIARDETIYCPRTVVSSRMRVRGS